MHMTRTEFLSALEQYLSPLPYEERKDALNYYEDYFDAAGPENEEKTAAELGTPAEVARKILEEQGLASDASAAPQPPSAPPQKSSHWRMWLGGGLAVLAIAGFFYQGARAIPTQPTEPVSPASEIPASSAVLSSSSLTWEDSSGSPADVEFPRPVGETESQSTFQIPLEKLNERLTLDFSYGTVVFVTDPDAAFATFQFDNFEGDRLTRTTDGTGKLTFRYELSNYVKLSNANEAVLTITLPETTLKKLNISIGSGDLDLGTLQADELNVSLAAGDLHADTLTAEKLSVSQAAGDLSIQQLTASNVEISTAAGDVHIGLLSGGTDLSLSGASGDFDVTLEGSPSDYYIQANTMIGSTLQTSSPIENSDPASPRKLQLSVVAGDATLRFTES